MIKFLTSNFGNSHEIDGKKIPNEFNNENGIVNQIKKSLKKQNTILYIASNSNDFEKIKIYSNILFASLKLSGISFENYIVLDSKNKTYAKEYVEHSDLIFLSGGDTYIQNLFFEEINLKKLLKSFDGVLIGHSAGALNMAANVFNSPEEMEKSEPIYFKGLDVTNINIEPHFIIDDSSFDEAKIYQRNKVLEESYKRKIYGQCDGSYIIEDNEGAVVYGETYLIENGKIQLICSNRQHLKIK